MFTIRNYSHNDIPACAQCFYESFFTGPITSNDRRFLEAYVQVLIEKCNFAYVAEVEGEVVGFISGSFIKTFNASLAKQFDQQKHYGMWCKFTLKYFLGLYKFSEQFRTAFQHFFQQIKEGRVLGLGTCDCELVSLCSRRDYRKGLGTAMLNSFVERCRKHDVKSVRLFTNTDATYTFYEKRGFTLMKEQPYNNAETQDKSIVYELLL